MQMVDFIPITQLMVILVIDTLVCSLAEAALPDLVPHIVYFPELGGVLQLFPALHTVTHCSECSEY